VEGPACKIKETGGLFNKRALVDRYQTGLIRWPVGSRPSAPDPTAGGARAGGGDTRRRSRRSWPEKSSRPRNHARVAPMRSQSDGELEHVLAREV
jgi:hypothetical protein